MARLLMPRLLAPLLPLVPLLVPLLPAAAAGGTPVPRRIVSLNLCADQYLLALADPAQIAAVTRLARDPEMSAEARRAAAVPIVRGGAEDVLALAPDLVLTAPGRQRDTIAAFGGAAFRTLAVPGADSYADIVAQVRLVAGAIGHPERGEALIRRMDAGLAPPPRAGGGAERDGGAGRGRIAAYYQRRGFLTGTGTLVDELIKRAGLVNLASRLERPPLSRLSLEALVLARPDFLIVESGTDRVADEGTELLHHPILAAIPRLRLPQAWTVCGGPSYVLAARSLTEQLRAIDARKR